MKRRKILIKLAEDRDLEMRKYSKNKKECFPRVRKSRKTKSWKLKEQFKVSVKESEYSSF